MSSTVLITGASTGIGYELAKLYAKDKFHVILVARGKDKLEQVAAELTKDYGCDTTVIACDLSEPKAAQELYDQVIAKNLQVDELINNAGFGNSGSFHENELSAELGMIQVNITSLVELCHLFLAEMVARKSGKILNVASTAAFQPGPGMANYFASKSYVLHFTEGLAEEVKKHNVTVSALCPGPTITEFFNRANMNDSALKNSILIPTMTGKKVAQIAYKKLKRKKVIIIPGLVNSLTAFSPRISPRFIVRKVAKLLNAK